MPSGFSVCFFILKSMLKLFKPFTILVCAHKGDYIMKYNLTYDI